MTSLPSKHKSYWKSSLPSLLHFPHCGFTAKLSKGHPVVRSAALTSNQDSNSSSAISKCMILENLHDLSVPQFPPRLGDDYHCPCLLILLLLCWMTTYIKQCGLSIHCKCSINYRHYYWHEKKCVLLTEESRNKSS